MAKRVNSRKIKRHRNYTVDEAARALGVTKPTVRNWINDGLPALKDQKPFLIIGSDLIAYLDARVPPKQKCRPHQCYCFKCRSPRNPAFGEVEFFQETAERGTIRALCIECTTVMHKCIRTDTIAAIERLVMVKIRQD